MDHLEDILRDASIEDPLLHNGRWYVTRDAALAGMTAVIGANAKPGRTLGSITTPRMNGDNLAIILCSYFDNPDQLDDENGWTADAIAGCDEVLAAIRLHYEPFK